MNLSSNYLMYFVCQNLYFIISISLFSCQASFMWLCTKKTSIISLIQNHAYSSLETREYSQLMSYWPTQNCFKFDDNMFG